MWSFVLYRLLLVLVQSIVLSLLASCVADGTRLREFCVILRKVANQRRFKLSIQADTPESRGATNHVETSSFFEPFRAFSITYIVQVFFQSTVTRNKASTTLLTFFLLRLNSHWPTLWEVKHRTILCAVHHHTNAIFFDAEIVAILWQFSNSFMTRNPEDFHSIGFTESVKQALTF